MLSEHCPVCGSTDVEQRTVNDRLRAVDPYGQRFELALRVPVWSCKSCRNCWQGEEAQAAHEAAYQRAVTQRSQAQAAA